MCVSGALGRASNATVAHAQSLAATMIIIANAVTGVLSVMVTNAAGTRKVGTFAVN